MSEDKINLENIYVVLSEPKGPINIGATARAMNNMGLTKLALVNPCDYTSEEARKMASGCNDTLLGADLYKNVKDAVAGAGFVVGMTCRSGKYRQNILDPEKLAEMLVTISHNNKIALLFGTERTGLTNDEVALCDILVTIPTSSSNLSLNLSQAVLLICYEIFKTSECSDIDAHDEGREIATSEEMEQMYSHMEEVFERIGYLNPQNPGHIMMVIRSIFARTILDPRDVKVLRGMIGKIDCYREWIDRGKRSRKEQQ